MKIDAQGVGERPSTRIGLVTVGVIISLIERREREFDRNQAENDQDPDRG
jgi:hypothetical protein